MADKVIVGSVDDSIDKAGGALWSMWDVSLFGETLVLLLMQRSCVLLVH